MLRDLGKLIVAKGFKKLPKVQKIARSNHTDWTARAWIWWLTSLVTRDIIWTKLRMETDYVQEECVLKKWIYLLHNTFLQYN